MRIINRSSEIVVPICLENVELCRDNIALRRNGKTCGRTMENCRIRAQLNFPHDRDFTSDKHANRVCVIACTASVAARDVK